MGPQRKPPRGALPDERVRAIRADLKEMSVMKVAQKHQLSRGCIENIRARLTYDYVKDEQ